MLQVSLVLGQRIVVAVVVVVVEAGKILSIIGAAAV